VAAKRRQIEDIKRLLTDAPWVEGDASQQDDFRRRLAAVEVQLDALEMTVLRALAPLAAGQAPGDEASIIKIAATETAQAITELFVELAGLYALPKFPDRSGRDWRANLAEIPAFAAPATAAYFLARAQTIYGGATEIQKNIIARQLGL
jgi:alkylation response protein AidB-like acyl-CoA dehydrogenase